MININQLYPTETIEAIRPEKIARLKKEIFMDGTNTDIYITNYQDYYFIVEGHHQVLAAGQLGIATVRSVLIERSELHYFSHDENLEKSLAAIGMNAIYDFEAIGGIHYSVYPPFYKQR